MWRILVAIKDGLVLLFLLMFFGALYAALSWSPKPAQSVGSGALLLKLDGTILEQPSEIDPIDRKSVVSGKSVSVRVDLGGRRILKQQHNRNTTDRSMQNT